MKDNIFSIESTGDREPDFDHYLGVMSPEAKAALAGLIRSAILLREWNDKAIITGHGPLNFDIANTTPGELLEEIFDNVAIVNANMEEVDEQSGI